MKKLKILSYGFFITCTRKGMFLLLGSKSMVKNLKYLTLPTEEEM